MKGLKDKIAHFLEQKEKRLTDCSFHEFLNEDIRNSLEEIFDELLCDIPYPLRYNVVSIPKEHTFSWFDVNETAKTKTKNPPEFDKYGFFTAWWDCRCIVNDGIFAQLDRKYIHTCDGSNNTGCIIKNHQGMFGVFKPLYNGMGGAVSYFLTREKENFPFEDVRIQSHPNGYACQDCLVYVMKKGKWGIIDMSFDRELTTLVPPTCATINEATAQMGMDLVSFDNFKGQYFGSGD